MGMGLACRKLMHIALLWRLIKTTVQCWRDDYAPSMGAAIAYYTLFSIAPLLFIAIAVAGFFFGENAARGEIVAQIRWVTGDEGAIAVEGLLRSVNQPGRGLIATVTGIVILFIGATSVFSELQNALDRIWRAPATKESSGWWNVIRTKLLSFGMVLGIGFLLLVSLLVSAALSALGSWWGGLLPHWGTLLQSINFVVSFGIIT